MLTRGKIHNVSDGANCQDSEDKEEDDEEMNDENCSENDSSSSKERQSCKVPFRSHSALQMKRTPSADRANMSPVLVRKGFSIGLEVLFIIFISSRLVNVHQDLILEEASLSLISLQRILHYQNVKLWRAQEARESG